MSSQATEPLGILVVDDDRALIRTLSDVLLLHGYAPFTATTATGGLQIAESMERAPAVALIDLQLPDMDGLELVSRLHGISELTQVVVLTGNASLDSAVAAMRESSIDYLIKPVQVEQLLRAVAVAGERWQRRYAEQALRQSEERYRLLFDRNPEPLLVLDRERHHFLAVNDAAVARYGFTHEQFLGMALRDLVVRTSGEVQALPEQSNELSDGAVIQHHRTRSGTVLEIEVTGHDLVFMERPARLLVAIDVTERRRSVRALRARERQQAAVASLGQTVVKVADLDNIFKAAVTSVAETLGTTFAAVTELIHDRGTLRVRAGYGWPDEFVRTVVLPSGSGSQSGFALQSMEPVVVKDFGTEKRFKVTPELLAEGVRSGAAVIVPGPHRPFGVLSVDTRDRRDFSQDDVHFLQAVAHIVGTAVERAARDMAFRQSQRLEAVGRLAGGVAHDFNNLLTAITGYAQLLLAEMDESNSMRDDVDQINKAAGRAAVLTRQLLAFSRQQVLQTKVVNLNEIVTETEKMLRRLIGDDVQLETALHPTLGSVKADPGQIEQVVVNLVVNARDAMPSGGSIVVQTSNDELDEAYAAEHSAVTPGPYVMLSVSDSGMGMDRETQARIFEPFYTTKGPEHGTGLGLSTVYGIVKQSGGHIWVYSEIDHGTTFKIYLPRVYESASRSPQEELPAVARHGTETILLVEDDETLRSLAHRILTQAGYSLLMARDGEEALRLAAETTGHIHLLATDVVMPNMRGGELAQRLAVARPEMKVLFLSGYTDATLVRQGLLDSGMLVLRKPFAAGSLLRRVREALDQPKAQ